jgi:hypothetical protein
MPSRQNFLTWARRSGNVDIRIFWPIQSFMTIRPRGRPTLSSQIRSSVCICVAALCALASPARAQGWPTADCQALLQSGFPKPLWGSSEKLGQDALLMMINYQLAVSLCQQDELLKIQRGQKPIDKLAAPPAPKPPKETAPAAAAVAPVPPAVPTPASPPPGASVP